MQPATMRPQKTPALRKNLTLKHSTESDGDEKEGPLHQMCTLGDFYDFDAAKHGVGGLDEEVRLELISVFASLAVPRDLAKRAGIKVPKGVLFYGPPGTGKTMLGRLIAKLFSTVPPKIINGPELLAGAIGSSEENVRDLTKEARMDYEAHGEHAALHIIIGDELDALAQERGSIKDGGAAGPVNNGVVASLLAEMDGANAVPNVLFIGLTNRREAIDPALLRPGRFTKQIKVGLPNEESRYSIIKVHTWRLEQEGFIGVDERGYRHLAAATQNFTGADIAAMVDKAIDMAVYEYRAEIDRVVREFPSAEEKSMRKRRGLLDQIHKEQADTIDRILTCKENRGLDAEEIMKQSLKKAMQADLCEPVTSKVNFAIDEAPLPILYMSGTRETPQKIGVRWCFGVADVKGKILEPNYEKSLLQAARKSCTVWAQNENGATPASTLSSAEAMLAEYMKSPSTYAGVRKLRGTTFDVAGRRGKGGRDFGFFQITLTHLLAAIKSIKPQIGTSRALLLPFQTKQPLCARHATIFNNVERAMQQVVQRNLGFRSLAVIGGGVRRRTGITTLVRHLACRSTELFPFTAILDIGYELTRDSTSGAVDRQFHKMLEEAEFAKSATMLIVDGLERLDPTDPLYHCIIECMSGSRYSGHVSLEHPFLYIVTSSKREERLVEVANRVIEADLTLQTTAEVQEAMQVLSREHSFLINETVSELPEGQVRTAIELLDA